MPKLVRRITHSRLASASMIGSVLFVVAGTVVFASIPDSAGVIHGCYVTTTGRLRVIDSPAQKCKNTETAISWNQIGPQGIQGPKGDTGATGPQGPQGPKGDTGAVGPPAQLADGSVTSAKFAPDAIAPNAAKLNGIASSGFIHGTGQYAVASGTANTGQAFLFYSSALNGPLDNYYVLGDCNDINTSGMQMALGSYAFKSAQVWMEVAGSAPTYTTFQYGAGGEFASGPTAPTDGGIQRITWHVLDSSGPVTITAWDHSAGGTCTFSAEGIRGS